MPSERGPVGDWYERFPPAKEDDLLRQAGFEIVSRPRVGPALWAKRHGKPLPQEIAMRKAREAK